MVRRGSPKPEVRVQLSPDLFPVAQRIERQLAGLKVVGLNPTWEICAAVVQW